MSKPTQEQLSIVEEISRDKKDQLIKVNSIAGSGKTSTALLVEDALRKKSISSGKPFRAKYMAYNKAIA